MTVPAEPYRGPEAIWVPAPGADDATHFNVLLSKPGATRGRRGFPVAEGYGEQTELITVLELATGERAWVIAHAEPLAEWARTELERMRSFIRERAATELAARKRDDPRFEPRAMGFGKQSDDSRYLLEASLAAFAAG